MTRFNCGIAHSLNIGCIWHTHRRECKWNIYWRYAYRLKSDCLHFSFNKCPIDTHDSASAKFSTNSHEYKNSHFLSALLSGRFYCYLFTYLQRWLWHSSSWRRIDSDSGAKRALSCHQESHQCTNVVLNQKNILNSANFMPLDSNILGWKLISKANLARWIWN